MRTLGLLQLFFLVVGESQYERCFDCFTFFLDTTIVVSTSVNGKSFSWRKKADCTDVVFLKNIISKIHSNFNFLEKLQRVNRMENKYSLIYIYIYIYKTVVSKNIYKSRLSTYSYQSTMLIKIQSQNNYKKNKKLS